MKHSLFYIWGSYPISWHLEKEGEKETRKKESAKEDEEEIIMYSLVMYVKICCRYCHH
jgi:hypothetical protein